SKSSDTDPKAIPERISILGGNSGSNQVPDIQAIDQFSSVSGILSKIDSASPEALKRWLMSRIGTLHHSRDVVELIIHRLASLDTEGTFNFLKDKLEFRSYYDIVLSKWAESDLSAALDAAFSVDPEGSMIREMMHRIDISTRREMFQS